MQLLEAWKDSLKMLKWQNLKLLLLVTLNSFVQGWRVLLNTYLLGVLAIVFAGSVALAIGMKGFFMQQELFTTNVYLVKIVEYIFTPLGFLAFLIFFMAVRCIPFIWLLAIRPSVEQKTATYFLSYIKKFWYVIWLLFFINKTPLFIQVFLILFLLDSNGSMRAFFDSIVRSFKMSWYNLPVLIVVSFLNMITSILLGGGFLLSRFNFNDLSGLLVSFYSPVLLVLFALSFFGLYLFQICLFTNIYIKKLHDQFGLYFDQPE